MTRPPRMSALQCGSRCARSTALTLALLSLVAGLPPAQEHAPGRVLESVPASIRGEARYVFYLHGRIIEEQGRRPVHADFGVYEYDEVLRALATEGAEVISEPRPAGTRVGAYAELVVTDVKRLIAAGVEPRRITVIGFSKGGSIALIASSELADTSINFVFLAACHEAIMSAPQLRVAGRMLSIHESSDELGLSCEPLFERAAAGSVHEEVVIETGERHGAFYRPRAEWLLPTLRWIKAGAGRR